MSASNLTMLFKYFTGGLELVSALLLVFGRRFAGGGLALLVLVGAVFAHLAILGVSTPMSNAPGAESNPMLFAMALVSSPWRRCHLDGASYRGASDQLAMR